MSEDMRLQLEEQTETLLARFILDKTFNGVSIAEDQKFAGSRKIKRLGEFTSYEARTMSTFVLSEVQHD